MIEIFKLAYENPGTTCLFIILIGLCFPSISFRRTREAHKDDKEDKSKEEPHE